MIRIPAILTVMILVLVPATAEALDFAIYDISAPGLELTTAELDVVIDATQAWRSAFVDPITVTLNVGFAELSNPDTIANAKTAMGIYNWGLVKIKMFVDTFDPGFGSEEFFANGQLPSAVSGVPVIDINGGTSFRDELRLSTANAKALGLTPSIHPWYGGALPNNADIQITFNKVFRSLFDLNRADGIDPNMFDFGGTMIHEIGHGLGFNSGVDHQDINAGVDLPPTTLDLWRFSDTGNSHDLETESRQFTAGPAEYYDSVLNNVPLSHGEAVSDPDCDLLNSDKCQAGHWSASTPFLMDPTSIAGEFAFLFDTDKHALDYIGYNRAPLSVTSLEQAPLKIGFFNLMPGQGAPSFNDDFNAFAPPPDADNITPPFPPDFAARIGLDFGPGFENRSAIGFVKFEDEHPNPFAPINHIDPADVTGEVNLDPPFDPVVLIPPAITEFYFESDATAGVEFTGMAAMSDLGAMFDPTIGLYGGYRISIDLDGMGDNEVGDIDANVTILLMAQVPGVPDPNLQNIFQTGLDPDNVMILYDPQAFGVPEPSSLALLALGATGITAFRRRRKSQVA